NAWKRKGTRRQNLLETTEFSNSNGQLLDRWRLLAGWICLVNRVIVRIIVLIGNWTSRIIRRPIKRILTRKSPGTWSVEASTQIIEVRTWVELFAGIEVNIRRGPGLADDVAESVVVVAVGNRTSHVHQEADVAVSVVAVEAGAAGLA